MFSCAKLQISENINKFFNSECKKCLHILLSREKIWLTKTGLIKTENTKTEQINGLFLGFFMRKSPFICSVSQKRPD